MKEQAREKYERLIAVLSQKRSYLPLVIISIVGMLAPALTVVWIILDFLGTSAKAMVNDGEYGPLLIFVMPFLFIFLAGLSSGYVFSCLAGVLEVIFSITAAKIPKAKVKRILWRIYMILFPLHTALNLLMGIGGVLFYFLYDHESIEEVLYISSFGLTTVVAGGVSLVIAAVQIAEVIAVRKRCKKYLSEGISGDELLEEAAEERRQKKKNPRPDISLAKAKRSGTVLLVISIVSLIAAFASLVLITFVKIWKIWAPSLGMAAFFPIPLIGLILSLVLVIYTITKGKEKPYKRTYVALGLNGASLAVILIPTIMAVGVLLRLFFTGDVLSSREIYLNNLKELHGTEFDFVGANCVASYEHPEIILEEKEAKYNQAYHRGYVAKLEEAKLQEELQQFFPGALVILNCSDIQITWQEDFDFEGTTLEENIRRAVHDEDGSVGEVQIEILIDKKIGTSQKYKSEFEYFTTKMKEYEANDQLVPVTIVTLYWVDAETIERAKEYLTHGVMKLDYNWDDNVWGFREDWHTDYSKEDLGNPPRIFGNFKKGIKNEMDLLEYTNRRRMLEASN